MTFLVTNDGSTQYFAVIVQGNLPNPDHELYKDRRMVPDDIVYSLLELAVKNKDSPMNTANRIA